VFKKYDYGSDAANIEKYGSKIPPSLNVGDIKKVPIAMFVGLQDDLADPVDTRNLRSSLNTVSFYQEYDQMDHGSFLIGKNMDYFSDVIAQLHKANEEALVYIQ